MRARSAAIAGLVALAACSGGDDSTTFCSLVVNADPLPGLDSGDVADNLDAVLDHLREMRDSAPGAVEDEVGVLVDYVERLQAADGSGATIDDLAAVSDEGVAAASAVIRGWAADNCEREPA